MDKGYRHSNANPMDSANVFSKIFFCWLNPLLRIGYKRTLNVEDMYNVCHADDAAILIDSLQRQWELQLKRKERGHSPSLLMAIARMTCTRWIFSIALAFVQEIAKTVQAILIGRLIMYFVPDSAMTLLDVCMVASGAVLAGFVNVVFHHTYFFQVCSSGMRIRVAASGLLYRKVLKLSTAAMGETTTGQIVNLFSNDATKFDSASFHVSYLVVAPVHLVVVMVLLWHFIGPPSLMGLVAVLLFTPVQTLMGKVFSTLRLRTSKQTDERVRLMDELIAGMRVIKFYCWEKPFIELLSKVRSSELAALWTQRKADVITKVPSFVSRQTFVMCVVMATTMLAGQPLSASFLFTVMALAENTMWNMTGYFALAIMYGSQGMASCRRIQRVLLLEEAQALDDGVLSCSELTRPGTDNAMPEQEPLIDSSDRESAVTHDKDVMVILSRVSLHWPSQERNQLALEDITANVKMGELLAVVGPVGAGKSSLLMSILGECPVLSGNLSVRGNIAYVSQQAWIFTATIKDNILFGQKFDQKRYSAAIELCALEKDLSLFPYGDLSLVGEKGIALSGGQKARVSLARALYRDAQIYLLDDPLSAVDTAVGKHLFEKCIRGHLGNRAVILVTHQLQYLEKATRILVLKDGKQLALGVFEELNNSGVDFTELLKCYEEEDNSKPNESCLMDQLPVGVAVPGMSQRFAKTEHKEPIEKTPASSPDTQIDSTPCAPVDADPGSSERGSSSSNPSELALYQTLKSESSHHIHTHSDSAPVRGVYEGSNSGIPIISNDAYQSSTDLRGKEGLVSEQQAETIAEGRISSQVYWRYMLAGGNIFISLLVCLLLILAQVCAVLFDWWLSHWSTQEELSSRNTSQLDLNVTSRNNTSSDGQEMTNLESVDEMFYFSVLLGILGSLILTAAIRTLVFHRVCLLASESLHSRMLQAVIRCPMSFFDTNPVGRILNRFSKDTSQMDDLFPLTAFDFLSCLLQCLAIFVVSVVINPWMIILLTPMMIGIFFLRRYYIATSRNIKRLEGITNSPVYSYLSATLAGLYTVRAYKVQNMCVSEFAEHQNLHTEAWCLFLASSRWLAIRLEGLCCLFVAGVIFLGIFTKDNIGLSVGSVGLAITYSLFVMDMFQWMIRQSAEVENLMTSIERILEYCNLPSEAPLEIDTKPASDWPTNGSIAFHDASLQYSKMGPVVIDKLTLEIRPSEKVGIVGRTGAGKSSLLTMLFRICEPTGAIIIDGLNVLNLGLHDLRRKISIIPQDPVLFSGTIRYNLDPFNQYSDNQIWDALQQVQMNQTIVKLPGGLEAKVYSGGSNFSVGQRQLLCLARAILCRNKILVIDEATANVDLRTDALIQKTIRDNFHSCTVLTIAHRLQTIMDSDRVLVMDQGKVAEFDQPFMLLSDTNSLLYKLAMMTGSTEFRQLITAAKDAFRQTQSPSVLSTNGTLN